VRVAAARSSTQQQQCQPDLTDRFFLEQRPPSGNFFVSASAAFFCVDLQITRAFCGASRQSRNSTFNIVAASSFFSAAADEIHSDMFDAAQ